MKILLATGIYPPAIGGPATYVQALAGELKRLGHEVAVMTYGDGAISDQRLANSNKTEEAARCPLSAVRSSNVVYVSNRGGPIVRWLRYAKVLRVHGKDADIVECFSSVSCGVPLRLSGLKTPKRVLRLGGDFLWERYTDLGGNKSLAEWHRSYRVLLWPLRLLELWIYRAFDHIVFSSKFQEAMTARSFRLLPRHSVIENAVGQGPSPWPSPVHPEHSRRAGRGNPHDPFKLLFLGRFVGFKNLPRLLYAVEQLPWVTLTLVGDGPMKRKLLQIVRMHGLQLRVTFLPTVHGEEKQRVFREHDLLVLSSLTELTPHAAVEARIAGLPVLLTTETGLPPAHAAGMILRPLRTSKEIAAAVQEVAAQYENIAQSASTPLQERLWRTVAEEHIQLFQQLRSSDSSVSSVSSVSSL